MSHLKFYVGLLEYAPFRIQHLAESFLMNFKKILLVIIFTSMNLANGQTDAPDGHAPIGIMGDHLHESGEFMVSYRSMRMRMEGNLVGDESVSPEQIAMTIANRFANPPMMPPTLRVVPTEMTTTMHMVGLMYAPTDNITLMGMVNLVDRKMDHITFQGPMGNNQLGGFTTRTDGLGDTKLGALIGLVNEPDRKLILNLGISIPTGDIEETDQILTPMNTTPSPRLPYPMQLGSGTWDIEPGLTYIGAKHRIGWGSQVKLLYRLDENDESYSLGDQVTWSSWGSYRFNNNISASLRLTWTDLDAIDGIDPMIAAPVQTADPANFGGKRWDFGVGINTIWEGNHRISLEYENTFDMDVNGVQMEMESMLTLGYQLAFE